MTDSTARFKFSRREKKTPLENTRLKDGPVGLKRSILLQYFIKYIEYTVYVCMCRVCEYIIHSVCVTLGVL